MSIGAPRSLWRLLKAVFGWPSTHLPKCPSSGSEQYDAHLGPFDVALQALARKNQVIQELRETVDEQDAEIHYLTAQVKQLRCQIDQMHESQIYPLNTQQQRDIFYRRFLNDN